jgi:hypothetical protein
MISCELNYPLVLNYLLRVEPEYFYIDLQLSIELYVT